MKRNGKNISKQKPQRLHWVINLKIMCVLKRHPGNIREGAVDMTNPPGNPWKSVFEREDNAMIKSFQGCLQSDIDHTVEAQILNLESGLL